MGLFDSIGKAVGSIFGGAGGTSGTETQYQQSPEQQQAWSVLWPLLQQLGGFTGTQLGQYGQTGQLYNVPAMPEMYGLPSYQIPGMPAVPKAVTPQGDWYANLDPAIKAGIKQPYEEQAKQLQEQLGYSAGSAQGYSGAGAAGLGKFWGQATPQMALQAWNMIVPELQRVGQQTYAGQLQKRGEGLSELQANYMAELARNQAGYQAALQQRGEQMGSSQAIWQLLPQLLGLGQSAFGQGITTQPQNAFQTYLAPLISSLGPASILAAAL